MHCGFLFFVLCIGYISAEKKVVHLVPEKLVEVLPVLVQCGDETKISPEAITQYRNGKVLSADENFKKFRYCLFTKSGYAEKNGHVKVDKALEVFPKDADRNGIRKVMEECNKEDGANPADTVYQFVKCFIEKSSYTVKV